MLRLAAALTAYMVASAPAAALVGGAPGANNAEGAPHAVMLVGAGGGFCTGVVIARDLVLTAGHCVRPGAAYKVLDFDAERRPLLRDVLRTERHPQFRMENLLAHRATADVALLKLALPLPPRFAPATFLAAGEVPRVGDQLLVAGFGVTVRGDGRTGGTLRVARLVTTGRPGTLQVRLVDPATQGERAGLGACTGDSGAPVFREAGGRLFLLGLVSWSTGPRQSGGCGGLTGVQPLVLYRDWIAATARRLGSPLGQ